MNESSIYEVCTHSKNLSILAASNVCYSTLSSHQSHRSTHCTVTESYQHSAGYVHFDVNIITDAIVVGGNSATSEANTESRFWREWFHLRWQQSGEIASFLQGNGLLRLHWVAELSGKFNTWKTMSNILYCIVLSFISIMTLLLLILYHDQLPDSYLLHCVYSR